jgi:hypothetical protein
VSGRDPTEPVPEIVVPLPSAPEPVPDVDDAEPPPGVVDLVARSARLGVDVVGLVAGELASASTRFARSVLPPAVADKPLESVEDRVDKQVEAARQREELSRDDALDAAQAVLNQTIGAVLDMIDWDALIQKIPVEKVVANVDLGGIVRESTTGLAGETIDAVRVQMMGLDLWTARVVDKLIRRKYPRDLVVPGYDVHAPEVRVPKDLR